MLHIRNLDIATGGVNDLLAEALTVRKCGNFRATTAEKMMKLSCLHTKRSY